MSSKFKILPLLLVSLVTACGGSDEAKILPVANNDSAITINNQSVNIAVLQNDSDGDGDTLSLTSILTAPANGSATISGNQIDYTPSLNHIGTDSFTYELSDGKNLATATVSIENTQTITLTGSATDSPITNAKITATVNGIESKTIANQNGDYSIEILLSSFSGNILLKAQGEVGSAQTQATLFSFVGSVENLISQAGENRVANQQTSATLNINQLSTAKYLLALAKNKSVNSVDSEQFARLTALSKSTNLLELAAFIKLIIDNDNYSLPEGQSIESFFISAENPDPNQRIRGFLMQNGLINTSGDYSENYATDLNSAISETADDFKLMFDAEAFLTPGQKFVAYVGDLEDGFLPRIADIYELTTATTGIYWSGIEFDSIKYDFEWKVEDGKLHITYDTDNLVGNESFPTYSYFEVFRFGEEAIAKAAEINEGFGFPSGQIRILSRPKEDILTLVANENEELQVFRKRTEQDVLFLPDENEIHQFTFDQEFLHSNTLVSISSGQMLSQDLLEGQWLTHLLYQYIPDIPTEEEYLWLGDNLRLNADILTLNEDKTASTKFTNDSFTWSLTNDRTLTLTGNSQTIDITPFKQNSDGFAALFVETVDGVVTREYVREFYKLDAQVDASYLSLITSKTEAHISLLGATEPRVWESGKLGIDYFLGYQFYQDNTVDRVGVFYEDYEFKTNPYFDIGASWHKRTVTQEGNSLAFTYNQDTIIRQRNWLIIKRNDAGRIWVIESIFFTRDENENGIFDRFTTITQPRLNSFIKVDLSEYAEVWANSNQNEIGQP